jgi:single-strand DNA-binding protein
MSRQFNKITFVGHLGNEPEMRYTPSGKPVTSFNVASNDQYTNERGETIKITTWFRCTSWGKPAEIHNEYLRKGSKVLIEGKLHPDPKTGRPEIWTRQDGSAATDYNVTVKELYFLDSKNGGIPEGGSGQNEPPAATVEDDFPY